MTPTERIKFRIYDTPRPGGSKRAFVVKGRAIITEDCKGSKTWREAVKTAALAAYHGPLLEGALAFKVTFFMARPKSHYRTGRHAGELKANAAKWHEKRPDATKLMRSTEDALAGIVWRDDSQIAFQTAAKQYAEKPGALVTVERIHDEPVRP